ncbi:MAG: hypothetical protein H5T70_01545 [Chloroflexi bacterium]|nr:hypothetical protein [Chloroflexota bacterium]MBC7315090.1 hypothetical protein [Chloroflexota bacterium]
MEVIVGAVVALVILAGIHRPPKERLLAPRRGLGHSSRDGFFRLTSNVSPKRTAAYWWFCEPAKRAR